MIAQLDLFGAPQPAPPPPTRPVPRRAAEPVPTPATIPWARLLAAHPDVATRVMVQCSALYTGVVLESLALGPAGQHWLMADKTIRDVQADPGRRGRYVYLTPRDAIALHTRHPMIRIGGGHALLHLSLRGRRRGRAGRAAPATRDDRA